MTEQRVEREATFEASPEEVWEAITDERLLTEWLADEAQLEPEPGGAVSFRVGDERRDGRVERLEEGRRLAFTWSRHGGDESLVEFTIEPVVVGTRLVVTERALTGPVAMAAAGADWHQALARLARALELVLAVA